MQFFLAPILAASILFAGCANISPTILTPEAVQTDITVSGALVVNKVTPKAKAVIHQVATNMMALSVSNFSYQAVTDILAAAKVQVSPQDMPLVNAVINGGVLVINLAEAKFGEHNPRVIAYVQAVSNGLLSAGF